MPRIPICGGFISKYIAALLLLACILCPAPAANAAEPVLEVIPLHHRSAAELLPMVRDFVAKDGIITAADAKLLIRTTPANLKELRELIAKLDVPLRRLVVTVKQLSGEAARRAAAEERRRSTNDGGPARTSRVWETDSRDDANRVQQVQVTEGGEAFIDVGRKIPISDFAVSQSRSGTLMEQKTRYLGATTGFSVRPHVSGDSVSVDITPYQTTRSGVATPPELNTQALHTTVSGKLGEWITVGASASGGDEADQSVTEYSTGQRGEQDRIILLRVTLTR